MKNISFAMTTDQIRNQTKTVTRRFGWLCLKPGDILQPVVKGMGLKKGETVQKIGPPIRIISTRIERLDHITAEDCRREGFPELDPAGFVDMLMKHYGLHDRGQPCNRIEFEYLEGQS